MTALRDAAGRSAELLRRVDDGSVPVPGLTWTAAETAAHMIGELRDYTQALTRHEVAERDMGLLAGLLENAAETYLAAASVANEDAAIPAANGLVLSPSTMTSLLLGEQVIHGLDVARAARTRWDIRPRDALLVTPGALSVAPYYLSRSALTMRASFELRIRGANGYRMAVDHGTATITAAGERADCVITADPVAFMLLGFGRITQWSPILRGKLRAGGRKPWLAMRFATMLSSP
jgi:hypothetical protein